MAIIRVGTDKEFLTIQGAFNNAISGDTILIDEGTYKEVLYFVDKAVNLIGDTNYPAEGKVIIKPVSYSSVSVLRYNIPLRVLYATSEPERTMYIEGINLVSDEDSFEFSVVRLEQLVAGTTSALKIVFNKCILDFSKGTGKSGGGVVFASQLNTGYPVSSVTLTHCKILWASGDLMVDSEFNLIPEKILTKCKLSDYPPSNVFGTVVTPENNDYIFIDNENDFQYGPTYSSYITAVPPTHCFSGIVSVNDTPVVRDLKIFRRDNGLFLDVITSSGVTGEYYYETTFGGYHNIVCSDNSTAPYYNDLIKSKCIPKQLPLNYTPIVHTPQYVRTFVIDVADNWGSSSYISIRSVEFLFEGVITQLINTVNFEAWSTSQYSTNYPACYAFDGSLSKIGTWTATSWVSQYCVLINQRLVCIFSSQIPIDEIRINNGHHIGTTTDAGAKNTKIYISPSYRRYAEYGVSIIDGIEIFDGVIPEHISADVEDPFYIYL